MKKTPNFWRIKIEEKLVPVLSMIVPTCQISDRNIERFLNTLSYKHLLTDEEILAVFCKVKSLRYHNPIEFRRFQSMDNSGMVRINYLCQMSSVCINCDLVYIDELSEKEKEKLRSASSLKL
jgi:hypothetical protein